MTVWPVLESIRVVTGSQRQDTVFAFSRLITTQCSMTSADGGGIWLRSGAGAAAGGGGWGEATGFFLAEHPTRHSSPNKNRMEQNFFIATGSRLPAQYNPARWTEPIASGMPYAGIFSRAPSRLRKWSLIVSRSTVS